MTGKQGLGPLGCSLNVWGTTLVVKKKRKDPQKRKKTADWLTGWVWSGEREIGNQIQCGHNYVEWGFMHTATTGSAAGPKVQRKKIALFFFFLVLSFVLRSIRGDTLGHGHWAPLI
jgi:hypothetical protein